MADLPGFKNLRLLAQQPIAVTALSRMETLIDPGCLEKRYALELTFESNHRVNVPLTEKLYESILDELKRQPGVGLEQRMTARGAVVSAGLEKALVREQVLPLDATGEQVYDALRAVSGRERKAPAAPAKELEAPEELTSEPASDPLLLNHTIFDSEEGE